MGIISSNSNTPSASFPTIGSVADITVDEPVRIIETQFGKRIVVTGASGPETTALVEGRPATPGERICVMLKPGSQDQAFCDALVEAKLPAAVDAVTVGGRFRIRFASEMDTGKPSPAKLYTARYDAPAPAAAGGTGDWD